MTTLPELSFEAHIERLLDWLEPRVPDVRAKSFRCFDSHDLKLEEGQWKLPAVALGELDSLRDLFEQLCEEGREWINLCGQGVTTQGEYLISIEYSRSTGREVTAVNLSGPPLNADGSVRQTPFITIV
jgi:hypothetical protein